MNEHSRNPLRLQTHQVPIGTLVKVTHDEYFGGPCGQATVAHLYVIAHTRDCDGSPLYALGSIHPDDWEKELGFSVAQYLGWNSMDHRSLVVRQAAHIKANLGEGQITVLGLSEDRLRGKYVPTT